MYTRKQFGLELKEKVKKRENLEEIGCWAYAMYLDHIVENKDRELDRVLLALQTLELGPDFAYSYVRLNEIADDLISGKTKINLNY
jgi:hypothetical protein